MAATQLSDGKGNFLSSFLPSFLPSLSRSLLEPTSDNSPRDRMMLPHAILNTLTRPPARPRPRPGGPSLRRSLLSLALVLEISRDTSRKKREKKRCVMHVLCGDRTTDRPSDRPTEDNEWDTVPSIPRFTHTHYTASMSSPNHPTKRSSNGAHEATPRHAGTRTRRGRTWLGK